MNKPIGGRGKKAPYETTHVRIPVDLKPQVEKLVEEFRSNGCTSNTESIQNLSISSDEFIEKMIQEFKNKNLFIIQESNEVSSDVLMNALSMNLEQSIELAKNLLSTRATKKDIINKLLTHLFGIEVSL